MKTFFILLLISTAHSKVRMEPNLGNRHFLKAKLIKIFGESSEKIINENLFFSSSDVGGPCDIYEQVFHYSENLLDENKKCIGGKSGSRYPLKGRHSNLRTASLIKTCFNLVENKEIIKNVSLRSKSLESHYKLFYPYNKSPKLLEEIKKNSSNDTQGLKKALFTICLSPDWQII